MTSALMRMPLMS